MTVDPAIIGHLYRRAGFGATPAERAAGVTRGYAATAEMLLGGLHAHEPNIPAVPHLTPPSVANRGQGGNTYEEYVNLVAWWVERMARTPNPMREKLTLLLHGQFPTGFDKVGLPYYMYRQNEIFRNEGAGAFDRLTQLVSIDPAMLIWLDTGSNQRTSPNENFARELMERFTMGIGNYSQRDVREAARALTGWSLSYPEGQFQFNNYSHDYGEKIFLGYRGDLNGEDIVTIATHSDAAMRWLPARMWSFLAYPVGPGDPVVSDLAPIFAKDLNVTDLLRAILHHPAFISASARTGLVKQPIEWVAGILRAFHLSVQDFAVVGGAGYLLSVLSNLGQIPFNPPTVGGWSSNQFWLSSASSLAKLNFAQTVLQVGKFGAVEDAAGPERAPMLADLLGVDSWTPRTLTVLNRVRDDVAKLIPLALTAPENVAN